MASRTRTALAVASAVGRLSGFTASNVEVDTWTGLTATYCLRRGATVIVRGVRTAGDLRHEYQLAGMNEYRSAQSARLSLNAEE